MNIEKFKIKSESPYDHWAQMNVSGLRVLDCGCGRWDAKDSSEYTPYFFIEKGATYVVGVDILRDEIEFFTQKNIANTEFLCINLNTSEKLISLINQYKINAVKMDIEGNEKIMFDISYDDFKDIEEVAIEYHLSVSKDALLKQLVELKLSDIKIGYLWIKGMGVIFAKR